MEQRLNPHHSTSPRPGACPIPTVRGLSRLQAADYVGVSPSMFDVMVTDGRMPKPKKVNSRVIWDRLALDQAFTRLPGGDADEAYDWTAEL